MLGWIFKKPIIKGLELPQAPVRAAQAHAKAAPAATAKAKRPSEPARKAPQAPGEAIDWRARLEAAGQDSTALLALAEGQAPLEVKLAAVQALQGEAALKLGERRLRNHERRVHRLAKQRLAHLVARRETAEQAAALISGANALLAEDPVPVNRLVELDQAWQALDAAHMDAALQAEFSALLQRIASTSLERDALAQRVRRWSAQARQALVELQAIAREAAAGQQDRALLLQACDTAQASRDNVPDAPETSTLHEALGQAIAAAQALHERLVLLEEVFSACEGETPAPGPADEQPAPDEAPARIDALQRWQAQPPLADASQAQALEQRLAAWQQERQQALAEVRQQRRSQQRAAAKELQRAERLSQLDSLAGLLEKAETTLDEGHLAETHQLLLGIDEQLHGGASDAALRARIDAVQARYAQLKGWQHWAGGRARDELTQQAEALAAVAGGPVEARTVKLSIKQQAEVIQDMRNRWKELDHLGGATSRALWQRFDTALKAAYEPVAAHLKALQAQREQNLQARQALVQALAEASLPDAQTGGDPTHWRPVAEALEHHLTEWRKLGPVEHTVPRKAQTSLLAAWEAAVQRLQEPLQQARQLAQKARQALIARARELAEQAAAGQTSRDTVPQVRDLQASWQHQARTLPLQRATENALWSEFKTTIDSIFAARDAAFNARDAEFKAHAADRLALVLRLEELTSDTPETQLRRTLNELQGLWQRCGPAPRAEAAALDERWQRALATARGHLNQSALQRWQTVCDALQAKHALATEWAAAHIAADERQTRWAALPALPAAWDEALRQRAGLAGATAPSLVAEAVDQCLLELEAAWNLPSPAAHEDARRALKLQAMKAAMESRRTPAKAARTTDELFAEVLRQTLLSEEQQTRLAGLLSALRRRGPP